MKAIHFVQTFALAAAMAVAVPVIGLTAGPGDYGKWGLDLTAGNPSVNPGDDFFEFANGKYLARTEIPADQTGVGSGRDVFNLTQEQLRTLIEGSASSTESRVGRLYLCFMDEARVEALDDKPIAPDLAQVAGIASREDFTRYMAHSYGGPGASIVALQIDADAKTPVSTLYIGQGGLGLPDRDYYLTDNFKSKKQAYGAYILRTLSMIKYPDADKAAASVLDFETRIAEASWAAADRRDIDHIYNPMTVSALQAYAPGIDWADFLHTAGIEHPGSVIVMENSAIQKILSLYAATPMQTLKAWQAFHVTDSAAPFLSKRFVDSNFDFSGKTMRGTPALRARWKRGVEIIDQALGEELGHEYVAKYFPPTSKAIMTSLVDNLKKAMVGRIHHLSWMSDATKTQALDKLSKMKVMIGYPVKWRDYASLKLDAGDLYGNLMRAAHFEWMYQLSHYAKPVDHEEWGMTPQTVDAYNGGLENKIVFPAGILQAPLFNPSADPAVNYGAIGAVIGHEITHGFDDQGRKIDADGRLRDWWTKGDADRFTAEAAKFAAQYDSYEPVAGMHINGKLTLGENIADLGGLLIAMDAYHESLGDKAAPVIDGLTGDQRLLLAFAQSWRGKSRDDAVRAQIASDPHSPRKFRVIGPTRNVDAWYDAFGVQAGTRYYLKPEDRVHVW